METDKKRAAAITWWHALMDIDKDTYFKVYKEDNFTPAAGPHQLTGREIEIIWATNSKILLWLDDYRDPLDKKTDWLVFSPLPRENLRVIWVKSFLEFTNYIIMNGMPDAICFDHDLADEHYAIGRPSGFKEFDYSLATEFTGYDAAKWLVQYCIKYKHTLPLYNIQSANPVGKQNIDSYLKNYLKSL